MTFDLASRRTTYGSSETRHYRSCLMYLQLFVYRLLMWNDTAATLQCAAGFRFNAYLFTYFHTSYIYKCVTKDVHSAG